MYKEEFLIAKMKEYYDVLRDLAQKNMFMWGSRAKELKKILIWAVKNKGRTNWVDHVYFSSLRSPDFGSPTFCSQVDGFLKIMKNAIKKAQEIETISQGELNGLE